MTKKNWLENKHIEGKITRKINQMQVIEIPLTSYRKFQ